jgi:magnesium transporter
MGTELTPVQKILVRLIHRNARPQLSRALTKIHPADIATIFPLIPEQEQQRLIDVLFEQRLAGRTLRELPETFLEEILEDIDDARLAEICRRLSPDDAADFLGHLSKERADRILSMLRELQDHLLALMTYPPDTAGGRMTSDFLALHETMTVEDALLAVRKNRHTDNLFYVYVVDDAEKLRGVLALRQLVLQDPEVVIREAMQRTVFKVKPDATQEEVANLIARYNLLAIPVVDDEGRLLGIVTVDDVIDVMREEATKDMYQLAGLDTADRVFVSPFRSVRLRLPWLLLNLATAFLVASIVGLFQNTIAQFTMLAMFMPVVAGLGGNAGTQTFTVIVRSLALGELDLKGARRAILKEASVGTLNGLVTGLVIAVVVYLWKHNLLLGIILASAQLINVFMAGVFGTIIPLVLRRLKFDPAITSSIFLTAVTDGCGFLAFLGLATLLLQYLL